MRTNETKRNLSRIASSLLFCGGLVAAGAIALTPAAEARERGNDHPRQDRHARHGDRARHDDYRFVDVPRRMHGHYRKDFRHAYAGRSYFRPHRHYHTTYRYPVVVRGVVRYQPYSYCNDELFVTPYAPLPRVVVGINIRPGIRIHADAY